MQNYYEMLEVSENASPEVIEKAYKVLVKKYHPDLQPDASKKQEAEMKMKQVNEAYEILSDTTKKQEYDYKLKQYREQKKAAGTEYARRVVNNSNVQSNNNSDSVINEKVKEAYKEAYRRAYNQYAQAYNENLRAQRQQEQYRVYNGANYVYRELTFKEKLVQKLDKFIKTGFIIIVLVAMIAIILLLPSTQRTLQELYDSSGVARIIIDLISNLVDKIDSLFKFKI